MPPLAHPPLTIPQVLKLNCTKFNFSQSSAGARRLARTEAQSRAADGREARRVSQTQMPRTTTRLAAADPAAAGSSSDAPPVKRKPAVFALLSCCCGDSVVHGHYVKPSVRRGPRGESRPRSNCKEVTALLRSSLLTPACRLIGGGPGPHVGGHRRVGPTRCPGTASKACSPLRRTWTLCPSREACPINR